MPPPKSSKSKNAHQHDKRHESGLAPPGKRIVKKLSNGHLNGKSAQPSVGVTSGFQPPRTIESVDPFDVTQDDAATTQCLERDRVGSDVSLEDIPGSDEMAEQQAYTSNAGGSGTAGKKPTLSGAGPSIFAVSTLLASYPLCDAISILILLLSLPPTLVLVIQTLFASLTFVPPTVSLSTIPNIKEIFNSSNFGYPALATILIVDVIFWMGWLLVRKSLQNIFLDLSQAVIAVSLSGASSSAGGPTYSIATCIAIVCVTHLLRYKAIHLTALDYLRSVIHKMDIGLSIDVPSFATNFVSSPPIERGWINTVLRTIIGIHIVSQGVTTCIRRSLVKANEQSTGIPSITKSDAEATIVPESTTRVNNGAADGALHSTAAQPTDSRASGSSALNRDNKPRESVNKKKRKQANQVRSQQPLWAAIASTKVTFVKEMEQRDAFDDSREAARMNGKQSYSSGTPSSTPDRMWLSDVRDTTIVTCIELDNSTAENFDNVQKDTDLASSDSSRPFYVRVNGAAWSSVRITMDPNEDDYTKKGESYRCEIFGLVPMTNYNCEVISSGKKVLCSVSVITRAASTAEQSASASSPPVPSNIRSSSPSTMLRQSVQQAENRLTETRNRTKKNRKDQKAIHADIKREITGLKNKLESSSGADDKNRGKLLQFSQHKSAAEEATSKLNAEIEALGEIPATETAAAEAKKKTWEAASSSKASAEKDFNKAKAEAAREIQGLETEINQTKAKHEKLTTRLAQRTQELESLTSKKEADVSAKQQRESQRAQTLQSREHEESQLRFHTASFETEHQNVTQKTQDAYQEIAALQSWSTQSGQPPPYYSSPPTPENVFAGVNGALGSPQSNGFPTFGPQAYQSPLHSAQASISHPQHGPRGRSSSMLSQYSGFTDPEPEPVRQQYSWPTEGHAIAGAIDRKERGGSSSLGSGSTGSNSNSPHPEARSFAGPIAPPSKDRPTQGSGAVNSTR